MSRRKKLKNPPGLHNRLFIDSASRNSAYYNMWYDVLLSLAVTRYEWRNVPDTIDVRYLELTLCTEGCAVWFRDEVVGRDLALKSSNFGRWDVYNVPMQRRAYGANGYQYPLTNENSVLIYNNVLRRPITNIISIFATRLTEADRTIDVNLQAQKTPLLILCDENEVLTMENIYMQYVGGEPVIFGRKGMNRDSVQALSTQAPLVTGEVHELRVAIFNEFLTLMGYSNVAGQKKERMIKDEVFRGMGGALASRADGLMMRQQAADAINRMFGLDLEIVFREELSDTLKEMYGIGEFGMSEESIEGGEEA